MRRAFSDYVKYLALSVMNLLEGSGSPISVRVNSAKFNKQRLQIIAEQSRNCRRSSHGPQITLEVQNYLPKPHEYKEVLGVEPLSFAVDKSAKPISHLSHYKLSAYVATLTETQQMKAKQAVYS